MGKKGNKALLLLALLLAGLALPVRLYAVGARFSSVLLLFLSALLFLLWGMNLLCFRNPHSRGWRRARRIYFIIIAAGVCFFIVLEAMVLYHARTDPATEPDCIIVLGAGINGREPSPILKTRLDAALSYLNRWPDKPVILSGGQGPDESVAEAEVMYRYLAGRGVSPERLYSETLSLCTEDNISYSFHVMEDIGINPRESVVAIVSSDFHLCRAKLLAAAHGAHPVGVAAETPWLYLRVNYFVREAFATAGEFLDISN